MNQLYRADTFDINKFLINPGYLASIVISLTAIIGRNSCRLMTVEKASVVRIILILKLYGKGTLWTISRK
jgi:hypothetical protein